jgi:UDP-3-O-[3-hydroxymyristoyl] N-acetylglucosamine deacetylase
VVKIHPVDLVRAGMGSKDPIPFLVEGMRNMEDRQRTIASTAGLSGVGLHLGDENHVQISPGVPNQGIVFHSMHGTNTLEILPACASNTSSGMLRTVLGKGRTRIETIEHVLAAMVGMGIDNAVVKVWGNEIPIMDGSAMAWVDLIREAGVLDQDVLRRRMVITKEIVVGSHDSWCSMRPSLDGSFTLRYDISYPHPLIGHQRLALRLTMDSFLGDLAASRTFGFIGDFEKIRALGLAKGASMENVLVFDGEGLAGPNTLRWPDEPIRHKMVDAIGDLFLLGHPVIGTFTGYRSGHHLNQMLVSTLLGDRSAWYIET